MSSIKEVCSSKTHPRLYYEVLFLKKIPHQHIIAPTSLPPLIKLRLTSKNFKNFINTHGLLLWACTNGYGPLPRLLFIGLGLSLTYYWIRPNFNMGANNCPPHTLWPEGNIACIKAQKYSSGLVSNHETNN